MYNSVSRSSQSVEQLGSTDERMKHAAQAHLEKELNNDTDSEPCVCNKQRLSSKQVTVLNTRDEDKSLIRIVHETLSSHKLTPSVYDMRRTICVL